MTTTALREIDVAPPRRKWPRYSHYAPTGVTWLAEMPAHWKIKRLRYAVSFPTKAEARVLPLDTPVSFVPMDAVGEYGGLALCQTRPLEHLLNGYTYFRDGDVLVAKITPCFENGKGALSESLENGIGFGTTELHVLRAGKEVLPRFLFYLTLGDHFRKLGTAEMYGAGGQKRVPERFLQNIRHPLPPLDEQRAIAAFLDRETARIDELIAKKERVIHLLKQNREVATSKAITQGINDGTELKTTDIPWLGDIPNHWQVIALKRVLESAEYGISDSLKEVGEIAVLRMGNLQDGEIDFSDLRYTDNVEGRVLLRPNDILFNRTNSLALIGKAALFQPSEEATVSFASYLVRFRTTGKILPEYLCFLLNRPETLDRARALALPAIGQANLNPNRYGYVPICVPPIDEQEKIVEYVKKLSLRLRIAVTEVWQAIRKLREYRSALISAAVTGQIDVRQHGKEAT